ncbi:MAG: type II secretion system protein [Phycisphaerales bacterium]
MHHSRPLSTSPPPRRGVTLIELLVALAIMAILIGILLPTLSTMRRRGIVLDDSNRIRMLQLAHVAYMSEHDAQMIDAGLPHGAPQDETVAWINTLKPYLDGSTEILKSPLDTSPHWPASDGGPGVPLDGSTDRFRRTSYGINNFLTQYAPLEPVRRMDAIRSPARTVHFLPMAEQGAFAGADHVHAENWWINDAFPDAPPALADDMVAINAVSGDDIETPEQSTAGWESRANYGFVDGHVETLSFVEVFRSPTRNRFDPDVSWTNADRLNREG